MDDRDQYGEAGFIYVVEMEGQGLFKIGKTINVRKRLAQFGIAPPYPYRLRFAYRIDHHDHRERFFHSIYKAFRLNGEWFRFDEYQVETLRRHLLLFQSEWLLNRTVDRIKESAFAGRGDAARLDRFLADVIHKHRRRATCLNQRIDHESANERVLRCEPSLPLVENYSEAVS